MTNVNRRFASALTALAVMGSGAQILAAPAQARDNIDQKNDAKISCTEAQAAVDKAQADLKAAQDNLAKLQENHKADKDKVEAAKKVVDEKQSALSDAKNALDDATTDEHVAELKADLADINDKIDALTKHHDEHVAELKEAQDVVADANEAIERLNVGRQKAEGQLDSDLKVREGEAKELKDTKADAEKQQKAIDFYSAQLDQWENQRKRLDAQQANAEQEAKDAEANIKGLKDDLKDLNEQLDAAKAKDAPQDQIDAQSKKVEDLKQAIADTKSEIADLESQKDQARADLAKNEKIVDDSAAAEDNEKKIAEIDEQINKLKNKQSGHENEIEELKFQIARAEEKVHNASQGIPSLERKVDRLQKAYDAAKTTAGKALAKKALDEAQDLLKRQKANTEHAQGQLDDLKKQLAALEGSDEDTASKIKELEAEKAELIKSGKSSDEDVAQAKKAIAADKATIGDLNNKINGLNGKLMNQQSELAQAKKKLCALKKGGDQAEIDRLNQRIDETNANIAKEQDKLDAAKQAVEDWGKASKQADDQAYDAKAELVQAQAQLSTDNKRIAELKDALADLDAQIAADKDARDKILDDIAAQESRAAEANERVAKLQAHIADIAADIKAQEQLRDEVQRQLEAADEPSSKVAKAETELHDASAALKAAENKVTTDEEAILEAEAIVKGREAALNAAQGKTGNCTADEQKPSEDKKDDLAKKVVISTDKGSAVTATTVSNDTPTHVAAPALPSTGV